MLKETPDELEGVDGGSAWPVALCLAVGEGDLAVLDIDDPGVGDGHAEDVRGQILVRGLAVVSPTAWELTFQSIVHAAGSILPISFRLTISALNLPRKILERVLTGK